MRYEEELIKAIESDIAAVDFLKKAINPPQLSWARKLLAKIKVWRAKSRRCKHLFIPTTWRLHIERDPQWDSKGTITDVRLYEDHEERRCIHCGINLFAGRE